MKEEIRIEFLFHAEKNRYLIEKFENFYSNFPVSYEIEKKMYIINSDSETWFNSIFFDNFDI